MVIAAPEEWLVNGEDRALRIVCREYALAFIRDGSATAATIAHFLRTGFLGNLDEGEMHKGIADALTILDAEAGERSKPRKARR